MSSKQSSFGSVLTSLSLRHPISVLAITVGLVLLSLFSLHQTSRDILPDLNVPTIYVAQAYGGMEPAQMEAYVTSLYENVFIFVSGVEHMESKSVQSMAVIKLQFYPGTNMGQALAEVANYVNRAKALMPPGTVPPFIIRFGVSNLPVGDLVFSSETRSLGELQNFAMTQVRPMFASLPGVSAAAPFGANSKAVIVSVDPKKLREYGLAASDVIQAVSQGNLISASGNIPVGDQYPMVSLNSVVQNIQELGDIPLRPGISSTVLKDVATVAVGSDIQTGYALVNGRRTVYIPVTKQDQASTLTVVNEVKANLKRFQSVLPDDVKVGFEFDQSGYVRNAIGALAFEGAMGAILTGLLVLLFLGDWRSSLIVVLNIPLAVMAAVAGLWATGQTINIMTLGGLALAIGVLVDETTVTIENIHAHMARGSSVPRASLEATSEIFIPKLFTLLAFLVVFTPAFFMTGIPRALFIPLALAVSFTLIASFILSATLVPVLTAWMLPSLHAPVAGGKRAAAGKKTGSFDGFRQRYAGTLAGMMAGRKGWLLGYLALTTLLIVGLFGFGIGREIFPRVDEGQFRVRFRAATGTAIAQTEKIVHKALEIIQQDVGGAQNIGSTVAYVGAQAYNFPINSVYLWTSGPQEAVLDVALKPGTGIRLDGLRERLRRDFAAQLPATAVSFEPTSLVERAMSGGSATPVEVAVSGYDLAAVRAYSAKILGALKTLPELRDLQYGQALDYPSIRVDLDRRAGGLEGVTAQRLSQALIPATSSSRFITPLFWADTKLGTSFLVQVQVPQGAVTSVDDVKRLPVSQNGSTLPLGSVASVTTSSALGEIDRYNSQRTLSITGNLQGMDLGRATQRIMAQLKLLEGEKPKGVTVALRGQMKPLKTMFQELGVGLALALVAVFLLLATNFGSFSLAAVIFGTVPAVLSGVAGALFISGTTLNVESYMGAIMAVGVALANSILLVTFAERDRVRQGDSVKAALEGAQSRLRPILMTSLAMMVGMVPMALGWTEGGDLAAPLGRAVIGGLVAATGTTLFIVPMLFAVIQRKRTTASPSLDPEDPESPYFEEV